MNEIIKNIEDAQLKANVDQFNVGDTVKVSAKIKEGNRERVQVFEGTVLKIQGTGVRKTFTVRKMSGNVGVERIYPVNSPFIESIELNKVGKVRRAKIYYLRNLTGKKARIKEKSVSSAEPAATTAAE